MIQHNNNLDVSPESSIVECKQNLFILIAIPIKLLSIQAALSAGNNIEEICSLAWLHLIVLHLRYHSYVKSEYKLHCQGHSESLFNCILNIKFICANKP
jgi:hypothetical protein